VIESCGKENEIALRINISYIYKRYTLYVTYIMPLTRLFRVNLEFTNEI